MGGVTLKNWQGKRTVGKKRKGSTRLASSNGANKHLTSTLPLVNSRKKNKDIRGSSARKKRKHTSFPASTRKREGMRSREKDILDYRNCKRDRVDVFTVKRRGHEKGSLDREERSSEGQFLHLPRIISYNFLLSKAEMM